MIVTLDGRRLEHDFGAGRTLQALLDEVRGAGAAGRLIVSVTINGEHCAESELADSLERPLDAADQVDLESGDRYTVAADALRSIAAHLAEIGALQPAVADQLNGGQVAEAIRQIGEFVGAWQACRDAVVQCGSLLGRDLVREEYAGHSVEQRLSELVERLRELRDALESRDMVLLADLIHYEMPALCETWHDLLEHLADGIMASAPADT